MGEHTTTENLKRFLKTQGTQRAAGDALGCTGSSISHWLIQGTCPRSIDLACLYLMGSGARTFRVRCDDEAESDRLRAILQATGFGFTEERG